MTVIPDWSRYRGCPSSRCDPQGCYFPVNPCWATRMQITIQQWLTAIFDVARNRTLFCRVDPVLFVGRSNRKEKNDIAWNFGITGVNFGIFIDSSCGT